MDKKFVLYKVIAKEVDIKIGTDNKHKNKNKGKHKGKDAFIKRFYKGDTFKFDPSKTYEPSIESLIDKGILQLLEEENPSAPTSTQEPKEKESKKGNFIDKFFNGNKHEERSPKPEAKPPVSHETKVTAFTIETPSYKKNNEERDNRENMENNSNFKEADFSQLMDSNKELKDLSRNIRSDIGLLRSNDMYQLNQKLNGIKDSMDRYPHPVIPSDFNRGLSILESTVREAFLKTRSSFVDVSTDVITKTSNQVNQSINQNTNSVNGLSSFARTSLSQMDAKINEMPGTIANTVNDQLDDTVKTATRSLKKSVEETKEAVEALQGKANVLDELKGKLDKVNISAKLQPLDHDDDVVIELAEQGHLIIENLMNAGRQYVALSKRVQELEVENARLKQEQENIAEMTGKAVEQRVRNDVTREMTQKIAKSFNNLDFVFTEEKLTSIKALLINQGIILNEEFKAGKVLLINDSNRSHYEVDVDFKYNGQGTYEIVESGFIWKDSNQSFKKAVARKSVNTGNKAPSQEVETDTTSEERKEVSVEPTKSSVESAAVTNNYVVENNEGENKQAEEMSPTEYQTVTAVEGECNELQLQAEQEFYSVEPQNLNNKQEEVSEASQTLEDKQEEGNNESQIPEDKQEVESEESQEDEAKQRLASAESESCC